MLLLSLLFIPGQPSILGFSSTPKGVVFLFSLFTCAAEQKETPCCKHEFSGIGTPNSKSVTSHIAHSHAEMLLN